MEHEKYVRFYMGINIGNVYHIIKHTGKHIVNLIWLILTEKRVFAYREDRDFLSFIAEVFKFFRRSF